MKVKETLVLALMFLGSFGILGINAGDPYRFFTWNVSYGVAHPLGVPQQVILVNGQFPGPDIHAVTNDNLIINVYNNLPEPFLFSWNGLQQRKNSWMDGVWGTNCPIPPGTNFTYKLQVKDQIGSYFYFPSLDFHKAAGGFGGIRVLSRPRIPVPFDPPAVDYTILIGDWYKTNHKRLKAILDHGNMIKEPNGVHINGRSSGTTFTVDQGKTYRLRISNVGLRHTLNFRIQGHEMKLVEVEGTHTQQNSYTSLDIHVGQTYSVLVTADQPAGNYYIATSTRFKKSTLTSTATLQYSNSARGLSGPIPAAPTNEVTWSINQARSIRTNLTASGPRPNPQGSYRYGLVKPTRTIWLANSAGQVNHKQRYAVNGVSFVPADTPLKLADHFDIKGVFKLGSIPDRHPAHKPMYLDTSVMAADHRAFVEIIFENKESILQTWHLDGNNFFVVGMDSGKWSPDSRKQYNLVDAVFRVTTHVYPRSWTAIYLPLDNVGMWNLRTEFWARQYLGQQFYIRVFNPAMSWRDEYSIPPNALLCGRAAGRQ